MKQSNAQHGRKHGFTLIEVLTVITIILLLITVFLPSFQAITREVRMSATRSTVTLLDSGCKSYYADHGVYPASGMSRLVVDMTGMELQSPLDDVVPTMCDNSLVASGDNKDYYPGEGFKTSARGKKYGPYGDTEQLKIDIEYDGNKPQYYFFMDAFDHEIQYFSAQTSNNYSSLTVPSELDAKFIDESPTPPYLNSTDYHGQPPDGFDDTDMPLLPYAIISPGYRWDVDNHLSGGDPGVEWWDLTLDADPRTDVNNAVVDKR